MKYSKIHKVVNETTGGKLWTHVYFDNGTIWVPALWEQGFIAQQVVVCEREKYRFLKWDPADKTLDFIGRAAYGQNIESLCYEFKLIEQKSFSRLAEVIKKSKDDQSRSESWDLSKDWVC